MSVAADREDPRRRLNRFGLGLLLVVVLLIAATFGYVQLFGRVLRDPNVPPSVTSPTSPRVKLFEYALVATIVVAGTAVLLWRQARRRRRSP
jgi:hypothetical protein